MRIPVLTIVMALAAISAAGGYDATTEYSDANNPNGVWSYQAGNALLSPVTGWAGDAWGTAQKGWLSNFTPFFFKSNGTEQFFHDWSMNTLVVHTTNPGDGAAFTLRFTSPTAGTANISGIIWEGRDIGRSNNWSVKKNGLSLTDGNVSSGDPYNSSNPFQFINGSGGAGSLQNVSVAAGDQLDLVITQTSGVGDYVAFNMTVDVTPVPEPAALVVFALGTVGLIRRRKQ